MGRRVAMLLWLFAISGCGSVGGPSLLGNDLWAGPDAADIAARDPGQGKDAFTEGVLVDDGERPDIADPDVESRDEGPTDTAEDQGDVCIPACVDRECGDDGCGGNCGTCAPSRCEDGAWVPAEKCIEGSCDVPDAQLCDDELVCTLDDCDPDSGCRHDILPGHCLIDDVCVAEGIAGGVCLVCDPEFPLGWTCTIGQSCDDNDPGTVEDQCVDDAAGNCWCAGQPEGADPCGMDLNPSCKPSDCTTAGGKAGRCASNPAMVCSCVALPESECSVAADCLGREWLVDCVGHWSCTKSRKCAATCDTTGCGDGTCDAKGGEDHSTCPKDCWVDTCGMQAGPLCMPAACTWKDGTTSKCGSDTAGACACTPPYGFCATALDCVGQMWPIRCDGHWACDGGACMPLCGKPCGNGTCEPAEGEDSSNCATDCQKHDASCDDGTEPLCNRLPPICTEYEILAYQLNCYVCVNPATCKPWGEAGCKADVDCQASNWCSPCGTSSCPLCDNCLPACVTHGCATEAEPTCLDTRPDCGEDRVAVVRNGCWVCVDRWTCEE